MNYEVTYRIDGRKTTINHLYKIYGQESIENTIELCRTSFIEDDAETFDGQYSYGFQMWKEFNDDCVRPYPIVNHVEFIFTVV